jgi:hypothetical protein
VLAIFHNGLGIGEVGAFKEQMFKLAQMLIGIPMLKVSTFAPILPIPCSSNTSGEKTSSTK